MITLWDLLVVDMFNSFWLAVIALALLMYIIFMIGKVSQVTCFNFLSIFILAMSIGYGYSFISIITTMMILITHLMAIPRFTDS